MLTFFKWRLAALHMGSFPAKQNNKEALPTHISYFLSVFTQVIWFSILGYFILQFQDFGAWRINAQNG